MGGASGTSGEIFGMGREIRRDEWTRGAAGFFAAALLLSLAGGGVVLSLERSPAGIRRSARALSARIDLNEATAAELDGLPGIGSKRAAGIIAYREARGGFGSVKELEDVPGIGAGTAEKLRSYLFVAGGEGAAENAGEGGGLSSPTE